MEGVTAKLGLVVVGEWISPMKRRKMYVLQAEGPAGTKAWRLEIVWQVLEGVVGCGLWKCLARGGWAMGLA